MVKRYIVCKGDKTTHGGTVLDGMNEWKIDGVPVACVGHQVACPQCQGTYPIVQGAANTTVMGKPVALEGMQTACGAILISSQTLSSVDVDPRSVCRPHRFRFFTPALFSATGLRIRK